MVQEVFIKTEQVLIAAKNEIYFPDLKFMVAGSGYNPLTQLLLMRQFKPYVFFKKTYIDHDSKVTFRVMITNPDTHCLQAHGNKKRENTSPFSLSNRKLLSFNYYSLI